VPASALSAVDLFPLMAKTCVTVVIACLHPVSMPPSCLLSGQLLLRVVGVIRSNSPPSCDSGIHPCGEFRLITSPHCQQLHIVCGCYQTAWCHVSYPSQPFLMLFLPRLFIPRRIFGAITLRVARCSISFRRPIRRRAITHCPAEMGWLCSM